MLDAPLLIVFVLWLSVVGLAVLMEKVASARAADAGWLGVVAAASTLWLAFSAPEASVVVDWVPSLGLSFELGSDSFGQVFLAVVGAVGMAVFAYSAVYFRGTWGCVAGTVC